MQKPNSLSVAIIILITIMAASFGFIALQMSKLDSANKKIASLESELKTFKDNSYDESNVDKDVYQAVFLNGASGQVYFGKMDDINEQFIKISDVYYLQEDGSSLAKLGDELHGPQDTMFIERTQILFWENLKNSGQITQAIKDHKAAQ